MYERAVYFLPRLVQKMAFLLNVLVTKEKFSRAALLNNGDVSFIDDMHISITHLPIRPLLNP